MKNNEEIVDVIRSYPYVAAGKTWIINDVKLVKMPDGDIVLPGSESTRIHKFIANEICGTPAQLNNKELDFLCAITVTKNVDIAEYLKITKANISFWKRPGKLVPENDSIKLKKWFWVKIFKKELYEKKIMLSLLDAMDESKFLSFLHDTANNVFKYKNVA